MAGNAAQTNMSAESAWAPEFELFDGCPSRHNRRFTRSHVNPYGTQVNPALCTQPRGHQGQTWAALSGRPAAELKPFSSEPTLGIPGFFCGNFRRVSTHAVSDATGGCASPVGALQPAPGG